MGVEDQLSTYLPILNYPPTYPKCTYLPTYLPTIYLPTYYIYLPTYLHSTVNETANRLTSLPSLMQTVWPSSPSSPLRLHPPVI